MAESALIEAAGIRFFVTRWSFGAGSPILLLHGGPGLWDYMGAIAEHLADLGEVASFDQRACGRSQGSVHGLSRAVDDVGAIADALGWDRFSIVGHSWGASLALAFALAHPSRVNKVVYACGVGVVPVWREIFTHRYAKLIAANKEPLPSLNEIEAAPVAERAAATARVFTDRWAIELHDRTNARERIQELMVEGVVANFDLTRELSPEVAEALEGDGILKRTLKLQTPFLMVHGQDDPRPVESVVPLVETLQHANLVVIPKAGHFAWLDDMPAFIEPIRRFLKDQSSPSA